MQLRNLFIAFPWMKWLLIGDEKAEANLQAGKEHAETFGVAKVETADDFLVAINACA